MKKSTRRSLLKGFGNVFAGCVIAGGMAVFAAIVLEVYAFFAYTDSFFTTSRNFISLEKAAPILHGSIVFLFCTFGLCLVVGYISYLVCISLKKRR